MNINKQRGASMLEFTLVLPVFIIFIVIVSEFGFLFNSLNTLTKSTQDAARYMSEVKTEFATRKPIAENLLKYGSISAATPPLLRNGNTLVTPVITDNGAHVTVTATYQHPLIMGNALDSLAILFGASSSFGSTYPLSAASVMRFTQ